jgi:hypothetical protein
VKVPGVGLTAGGVATGVRGSSAAVAKARRPVKTGRVTKERMVMMSVGLFLVMDVNVDDG